MNGVVTDRTTPRWASAGVETERVGAGAAVPEPAAPAAHNLP